MYQEFCVVFRLCCSRRVGCEVNESNTKLEYENEKDKQMLKELHLTLE